MKNFSDLGLGDSIVESISYMGFSEPTPIQAQSIPIILEKSDLVACAQTGTGKTAAFLLPIIQMISTAPQRKGIKALIIAPTRELAIQIEQQVQALSYFSGISSIAMYGGGDGDDWIAQKKALQKGADIIVATPGKLLSHIRTLNFQFTELEHLVLDEADRMLDIGFYDDIIEIIEHTSRTRQTLLFSATMDPKIRKLAKRILSKPKEVTIAVSKPAENVLQAAYLVNENKKIELIHSLLSGKDNYERILIFCSTKKKVQQLYRTLRKEGFSVAAISSDLAQQERENVLREFTATKVRILVGTDVVARGIDIKEIHLVINYDLPNDADDYVHRVGRTARANASGVALTFVNGKEKARFRKMEQQIGLKVHKMVYPPKT